MTDVPSQRTLYSARRRCRWTRDEELRLIRGVSRYGEGNWREIQRHCGFTRTRTNIDLKDKFRNLQKQGRLRELLDLIQ